MKEKPKIDALSEMKLNYERFNYTGKQKGQPIRDNVCIICGYKANSIKDSLCNECRKEFPVKNYF